ncbi:MULTISPECIES: ATP-grasp domain-containing protein [unclassified Streptomyces]|uniref:ATP-grasp domain-containing protein n=1 Tax=unclassified Streptomyces TaxID=2593676 RepID=UPI003330DA82
MPSSTGHPQVIICKWSEQLVRSMLDLTPHVFVILDEFDIAYMNPDPVLLTEVERVYRIKDFDSLEEVAAVATDLVMRGASVDHIVSFTEFSQFGAGYLGVLLGLVEDPMWHVSFRDKRLMKERVRRAGVATADWITLADPSREDDVAAVRDRLTFPIVVKPVAGSGTIGAIRVDKPNELLPALQAIVPDPHLKSHQLTAEEFVTGREYHVDALWHDGHPLYLLVSSYYRPRLSLLDPEAVPEPDGAPEDGSYLITEDDAPELYRRVTELHHQVNSALGITSGATHLEVFERPDGEMVFSEIASRMAGGWIGAVISEYLGYEIHTAIARATVTGQIPERRAGKPYLGALHLRPARAGRITAIPTVDEMRAVDGVLRAQRLRDVGDSVELTNPSEWCAFVVLGAESREEYEALARRVASELRTEVEPSD